MHLHDYLCSGQGRKETFCHQCAANVIASFNDWLKGITKEQTCLTLVYLTKMYAHSLVTVWCSRSYGNILPQCTPTFQSLAKKNTKEQQASYYSPSGTNDSFRPRPTHTSMSNWSAQGRKETFCRRCATNVFPRFCVQFYWNSEASLLGISLQACLLLLRMELRMPHGVS